MMAADPHTHRQTLGAKNVTNFISLSLTFKEIRSRFLKSEIQYLSISKIREKKPNTRLKQSTIKTWCDCNLASHDYVRFWTGIQVFLRRNWKMPTNPAYSMAGRNDKAMGSASRWSTGERLFRLPPAISPGRLLCDILMRSSDKHDLRDHPEMAKPVTLLSPH
ncbi:MAG: hypothetical protein MK161_09810 [Pirellulales bacterium]|nr:hypothetical protein [Pirellulales bacterium]